MGTEFAPSSPPSSTRKSRRPQDSHRGGMIFYCDEFPDERKCFHCRRESHAASDRAKLVLRQFARGLTAERFPKRASVAGNPGVAASSERSRIAGLQTSGSDETQL